MPERIEHARDLRGRRGKQPGRTSKHALELNGREVVVTAAPLDSLAQVLAKTLAAPECDDGRCGACHVLVDGELAPACRLPVVHAAGARVVTSEGLARDPLLAPVRRGLAKLEPRPCDACLPGLTVAARAFLDADSRLPGESAEEALAGNRCDCEGRALFVALVETIVRPPKAARATKRRKK